MAREEIRLRIVVVDQEGTNRVGTSVNNPMRVQQLATLVASLDVQLATIAAEANAIRLRLMAVTNQGRAAVTQHLNDLQKMAAEGQRIERKGKQLKHRERAQARQKASGHNLETQSMLVQLNSFSTYDPFATEEQQALVLELCKE
jgi:hypothetical protein